MPDKMHLEGELKIGLPSAESGEESFSPSEQMSRFAEAPAGLHCAGSSRAVTETGWFLLRNQGRFLLHSTVPDNRFLLLPMYCEGGVWGRLLHSPTSPLIHVVFVNLESTVFEVFGRQTSAAHMLHVEACIANT